MDVQMQDASAPLAVTPITSQPGSSTATPVNPTPAAAAQVDPAKLEALRKATLNSYKNKFLNLRDKFDRVNATNTEYHNTLTNAKKKEEALQEEINMLLDYLAVHGASDPEIARCLRQPSLQSPPPNASSKPTALNGS
ncbi:hypothetical protein CPB86DRAFT_759059 [Serendipita vermifera]|nr:hypothetical protein CPB86DRAFT_759059 [Serendipita vermifera]